MTYITTFNDRHMTILQPIRLQLDHAKPGDSFQVSAPSPAALADIRYILYSWLAYNNQKDLFKISRLNSLSFLVSRRETEPPEIKPLSAEADDFVKEHLLAVDDELEAVRIIQEKYPENTLKTLEILAKWKNFQGIGS